MTHKSEANFLYLLLGLLAALVVAPLASEFTDLPVTLVSEISLSVTMIVGVWSLMDSRRWFFTGICLVVADLILAAVNLISPMPGIELTITLIELAFVSLTFVFAVIYVFHSDGMHVNRIIGAICIYLLLGVLITILNVLVYQYVPNSFEGIELAEESTHSIDLLYYTFVTLTTLGYGDITPIGPLARSLAYLAAITGQFYIAILVARWLASI